MKKDKKSIAHFSCGVTSAVTTMLCHFEGHLEEIVYADVNSEHEDNYRFMKDFEEMLNKKVTSIKSDKYQNIFEVFDAKQYLVGIAGAPCTTEMKKIPMVKYLGERLITKKLAYGYTTDEKRRVDRFENNNPEVTLYTPLIKHGLDKQDCFYIMQELKLKLPKMYLMGYANANCIGCVKARKISYWRAIQEDFPNVFDWYAKKERAVGSKNDNGTRKGIAICSYIREGERIDAFLDEFEDKYMNIEPLRNVSISCGYSCGMQDGEISYSDNKLTSEPSFNGYFWANKLKEFYGIK